MKKIVLFCIFSAVCFVWTPFALSEESATTSEDSELAHKLTNPVADIISIPVDAVYDSNIGINDDGERYQVTIKPVVPFQLSESWNLITRTLIPLTSQSDIYPGAGDQSGLGDIDMSLFFSPVSSADGGLVWGIGPVLHFPTASDDLLGAEKWGAGPAGIILSMQKPWTLGLQVNHIWSFAGEEDRSDISTSLVQPFVSYTKGPWTGSLSAENTYNHETEEWAVPISLSLSKLIRLGKLPVKLLGGVAYWAESPDAGPEGFRYRFQATVVLPK